MLNNLLCFLLSVTLLLSGSVQYASSDSNLGIDIDIGFSSLNSDYHQETTKLPDKVDDQALVSESLITEVSFYFSLPSLPRSFTTFKTATAYPIRAPPVSRVV